MNHPLTTHILQHLGLPDLEVEELTYTQQSDRTLTVEFTTHSPNAPVQPTEQYDRFRVTSLSSDTELWQTYGGFDGTQPRTWTAELLIKP